MNRKLQITVLLICLSASVYLAHHAIVGKYGLDARSSLTHRASILAREIDRAEAVRARLAQDVKLLDPAAPEADLIDEMARRLLGFAHPDDIITPLPKT